MRGLGQGEVLRCPDRFGREVVLLTSQWANHALIRHPELSGQELAVARVLQYPDVITRDAKHPNGENFYALGVLSPPQHRVYLKVCVRFGAVGSPPQTMGVIITAFPCSPIKPSEVKLWP